VLAEGKYPSGRRKKPIEANVRDADQSRTRGLVEYTVRDPEVQDDPSPRDRPQTMSSRGLLGEADVGCWDRS
jgi:hypothetical protein